MESNYEGEKNNMTKKKVTYKTQSKTREEDKSQTVVRQAFDSFFQKKKGGRGLFVRHFHQPRKILRQMLFFFFYQNLSTRMKNSHIRVWRICKTFLYLSRDLFYHPLIGRRGWVSRDSPLPRVSSRGFSGMPVFLFYLTKYGGTDKARRCWRSEVLKKNPEINLEYGEGREKC